MDAEAEREQRVIDAEVAVSAAAWKACSDGGDLLVSVGGGCGQRAGRWQSHLGLLVEQQRLLDERRGYLVERERLLVEQERLLDQRHRHLVEREQLLDERERELERRERAADQREIDVELLRWDSP